VAVHKGNVYIADEYCNVIWEVSTTGTLTAVAGIPGNSNDGCGPEGVLATSSDLGAPWGVAVDADGNIFIADTSCDRVRKVIAKTGLIYTIAGSPVGPALGGPRSVATGPGGKVYVGERTAGDILELTPSGGQIVSPAAGSVLPATTVTFEWSGGPAGSHYQLDLSDRIGPIGQGSIFGAKNGNITNANSLVVPNLPCDGRTIHVQLSTFMNGQWQEPGRYTYFAPVCTSIRPQ
jgi:streptogramin lyase